MPAPLPQQLNIADWFLTERVREGRGDRIALRLDDRTLTYAEVDRRANRYGAALRALGVRQEERVLVAAADGVDFVAALFGALKIGAVAVMVNPELTVASLASIVARSRAPAAVVDAGAAGSFARAADDAGRRLSLLVAGGGRDPAEAGGLPTVDDLDVDEALTTVPTHRDDPAIWLFSGGTTGEPKIAVQTHRSFVNTTRCYGHGVVGYGPDDVTISVPKLYFGYATGSNLFFPFSVGASAVLFPGRPTAAGLFDRIAAHRATVLVGVPKLIHEMVGHPGADAADLSSLRVATSAGEALPPALHHRWSAAFGVELLDGLGTAEMWHIFVSNRPGRVRVGTLGEVVPGFDVRLCDDDGREVPVGEPGRPWVRGESRALGYWQDLDRTADAFRGEWVVTGDVLHRDADGYFTYVGRADEAMKVGGKWLVPSELEDCLVGHPDVAACAVVGVPDASGLTKPVGFVVPRGDATHRDAGALEDALKAHALAQLEAHKHPRRIVVLDELPRTHLGKVDRGALRRLAAEAGAATPR